VPQEALNSVWLPDGPFGGIEVVAQKEHALLLVPNSSLINIWELVELANPPVSTQGCMVVGKTFCQERA
jgi:hypothetical protein